MKVTMLSRRIGTPTARGNSAVSRATANPAYIDKFLTPQGFERSPPSGEPPEAFARFLERDRATGRFGPDWLARHVAALAPAQRRERAQHERVQLRVLTRGEEDLVAAVEQLSQAPGRFLDVEGLVRAVIRHRALQAGAAPGASTCCTTKSNPL